MRSGRTLGALLFTLLLGELLGCRQVRSADLTGTYAVTAASRRVLPAKFSLTSSKLVLNADGSFTASELPGLFYVPDRHPVRLESGSGVWKLVSREGEQQVQLEFHAIEGWTEGLPYEMQLNLARGQLFYFLGDPDQARRVTLAK